MAESGAGAAAAAAAGDSFDNILDNLTSIATLFAIFVLGSLIPMMKWLFSASKRMSERRSLRQKQQIMEIATEINKPIYENLNAVKEILEKQTEQSEAMIQNVEDISAKYNMMATSLHDLKEKQMSLNIRTQYMDKIFRDNIRFDPEKMKQQSGSGKSGKSSAVGARTKSRRQQQQQDDNNDDGFGNADIDQY